MASDIMNVYTNPAGWSNILRLHTPQPKKKSGRGWTKRFDDLRP